MASTSQLRNDFGFYDFLKGGPVHWEHHPSEDAIILRDLQCSGVLLDGKDGQRFARLYLSSSVAGLLHEQLTKHEKTSPLVSDIHILMELPARLKEKARGQKFGIGGSFKAYSINEDPNVLRRYEELREGGYPAHDWPLLGMDTLNGEVLLMIVDD